VFAPDFADEIVSGSCVTHDGAIVHAPTREALEGPHADTTPDATAAGETPADGDPTSYDAEVADDDGMPPEGTAAVDRQLDLPYDQEADQ